LQNNYGEIAARDAEVIAVTTQDLRAASGSIDSVGIAFPLAYDVSEEVPKEWDRFGNFGTNLADASVYVIDRDGKLVWQSLGDNYQHQVSADTVIDKLDQIGG